MRQVSFNVGSVIDRCYPFRSIKGFGHQQLTPLQNAEFIAWGAYENLLESTSFYDDDVATAWSPQTPDLYKDPDAPLWKQVNAVKAILEDAGVAIHAISCDLASHDCFSYGALTNPDPAIRKLAWKKIDRALKIGNAFGARVFVFDADAEGFDSPFALDWPGSFANLIEGLNHIEDCVKQFGYKNYAGACLSPKQSVPFLYGFINNVGDALSLIHGQLRTPQFWGVCPSTFQLQQAGWGAAPATLANLALSGGLAYLKVGSGTQRLPDRPLPPMIGSANIKETVHTFWILAKTGWQGTIEIDSMMTPAEFKNAQDFTARKQFLATTSSALTLAIELAARVIEEKLADLTPTEADLMATTIFCGLDIDALIKKTVKSGAEPEPEPIVETEPQAEQSHELHQEPEKTPEPEAKPDTPKKQQQENAKQKGKQAKQQKKAKQQPKPAEPEKKSEPVQPEPEEPKKKPEPVEPEKQPEPVKPEKKPEPAEPEKQPELVEPEKQPEPAQPEEVAAPEESAPQEEEGQEQAPESAEKPAAKPKRVYKRTTGIRKITKKSSGKK